MRVRATGREGDKEGLYQCSQCQRRYHRAEHLARHVRSHTKQRPYACWSCDKSFGRLDILKRHEATHGDGPGPRPRILRPLHGGAVDRVGRACRLCAATKSKCSEQKPCHRCVGKGLLCEYATVLEDPELFVGGARHQQQERQDQMRVPGASPSPEEEAGGQRTTPPTSVTLDSPGLLRPHPNQAPEYAPSLVHTYLDPVEDTQTPEGFFGAGWDFAMADYSYLETQCDEMGTDTLNPTPEEEPPGDPGTSAAGAEGREALSATGSWEPQSTENNEMERSHLAASEEGLGAPAASSRPLLRAPAPAMSLPAAARNSIVGMILNTTSRAKAAHVLAAFPSAGALSALLGVYARDWEAARIIDVVHLPTLRLDRQRPEVLGAMVAFGAVGAGSAVARKFGFALQEVWEENNADMRDIGLAQSFFLQQHMAFFSGVRRKVALAEACSSCMQVLAKNGGLLQGAMEDDDPGLGGLSGMGGQSLEAAWLRWSVRESQRRLVYAAYIMDAHVSMSHGSQATLSYADMKVPFPAPRALWKAETAARWREEMLLLLQSTPNTPGQPLCLGDLMADPTLAATHHAAAFDADFVASGFLAGLWALVKECHQLGAIGSQPGGAWSAMILSSRRVELCSMLRLFSSQAARLGNRPETELLSEVLLMHILAPPGGPALREIPLPPLPAYGSGSLTSAEYCTALWHAGRAVRAAVRCQAGVLRDVYATALFHAAVLLWWHGVASSSQKMGRGQDHPAAVYGADYCVLDGDEAHEHQVLGGRARLALLGSRLEPTPLENPAAVMECVKGVVEYNWRGQQMPPGAEEICRVLDNIGKAACSYGFEPGL
ncbi:hypothetical protein EsH8_V_000144 [Colletotrichum jinshuiense]